jgi:hypothetical protein
MRWLEDLGLPQYKDSFNKGGFHDRAEDFRDSL